MLYQKLAAFYLLVLDYLKIKKTPKTGPFYATRIHDRPALSLPILVHSHAVPFLTSADSFVDFNAKKNTFHVDHVEFSNSGDGDAIVNIVLPQLCSNYLLEVEPLSFVLKPKQSIEVRMSIKMRKCGVLKEVLYVDVRNGMRMCLPLRIVCKPQD
ncbi:hypothetical protein GEMRC1_001307 [Eukaryota sp. GEM-RC1]